MDARLRLVYWMYLFLDTSNLLKEIHALDASHLDYYSVLSAWAAFGKYWEMSSVPEACGPTVVQSHLKAAWLQQCHRLLGSHGRQYI